MAYRKYCAHTGCSRLIDITKTYCTEHERQSKERHAEYDKTQRDRQAKAYYNSAEWKTVRASVLARDTGIDVYLYMTQHRIVPATTVHHIVELREDYSKRNDMSNLISVSNETHEGIIKAAYSRAESKKEMQRALRKAVKDYQTIVVGGAKKV